MFVVANSARHTIPIGNGCNGAIAVVRLRCDGDSIDGGRLQPSIGVKRIRLDNWIRTWRSGGCCRDIASSQIVDITSFDTESVHDPDNATVKIDFHSSCRNDGSIGLCRFDNKRVSANGIVRHAFLRASHADDFRCKNLSALAVGDTRKSPARSLRCNEPTSRVEPVRRGRPSASINAWRGC